MRGLGRVAAGLCAALSWAAPGAAEDAAEQARVVAPGRKVSLELTIELEDGTTILSTVGGEAVVYQPGDASILPGLERALAGMAVGESKQGTLSAVEAHGEIDPELFQEVEAARIPEEDRRVGAELSFKVPNGEAQTVRVHEVRGDTITVDFNHPLAGHALRYKVRVLKIE